MAQINYPSFSTSAYSPNITALGSLMDGSLGVAANSFILPTSTFTTVTGKSFFPGQAVCLAGTTNMTVDASPAYPTVDGMFITPPATAPNSINVYGVIAFQQSNVDAITDKTCGVFACDNGARVLMKAGVAIATGDKVYWDTVNQVVTNVQSATTSTAFGTALTSAALNNAFFVQLRTPSVS